MRVAEGEHAAVARDEPVAVTRRSCGDADDRLVEVHAAGGAVVLRVARGEDAAVGADAPEPLPSGVEAMPTIGWFNDRRVDPIRDRDSSRHARLANAAAPAYAYHRQRDDRADRP